MEVRQPKSLKNIKLPLQLNVSFEKVYNLFSKYSSKDFKEHPFHKSAKVMAAKIDMFPELITGFSDLSLLKKHEETIDTLLEALFPEILSKNEIKTATIPFNFTSFKFTERFENIIQNAGEGYELKMRDFEEDELYIMACTLILGSVHNVQVDLKRPFFFDIPDKNLGTTKHYHVAFNADFMEIFPSENAPKITPKDIKTLLDNFDNIDIWKEKFPPNSYVFKGFGIMNLFDVTTDEIISSIRTNLLKKEDETIVDKLQKDLSNFFNIKDLKVGFSVFDISNVFQNSTRIKKAESILFEDEKNINCNDFFCDHIIDSIFKKVEITTISDVEKYGEQSNQNPFFKRLHKKNIGSIILIPMKASNGNDVALLEIASPRIYELNSVNQQKLRDMIPVFKAAVERNAEEYQNILEATIQEHYTSIHPTVKWKFYEAAEKYQTAVFNKEENLKLSQIVFDNVYPLYGQSDIKGSSLARNQAIKEDLTTQLSLAISVLKEACKTEKLPIYNELMFRVNEYLMHVEDGLKAGDEVGILDFLKREIYPVFNHIKDINKELSTLVTRYINRLDPVLNVVYEKRKAYEDSVTVLNDKLASFIDKKQDEAQTMFPHYFERYKTDGIEYNMYIGQSLVNNKKYDDLYLYNLRLWQLQLMYEMENVAMKATEEMDHKLRVASLILIHSNPLAIKFRMDEKQFDVDGAYNIRYEIIKKRIDKAHIKGTTERLTIPGKIAIVYSQENDAKEYVKYIKYLQSKKFFGKMEKLELEDLQGVSGLKALRVEVLYKKEFNSKKTITINELMEEFN